MLVRSVRCGAPRRTVSSAIGAASRDAAVPSTARIHGAGRAALVGLLLTLATACGGSEDDAPPNPSASPRPSPTPGFATARGFVLASFGFVFPDPPADACPGGFNRGPIERQAAGDPPLPDDCLDPTANVDPEFRTLDAPGTLDGLDIDDTVSRAGDGAQCAHDDFVASDGTPGIDDQLWRAIGCIRGFQDGDVVGSVVDGAVRDGSMTILVDVQGVDDPLNDDDVQVQIFSSRDAPPLGGDGSVLPYGTLSIDPDARYHSTVAHGRIENGVVLAGPFDVRIRLNIQIVTGDLGFRDAYVRLALGPDGAAEGGLFGFAPLEDVYAIFGRQAGTIGGKEALGYTCSGLHAALQRSADGHYDPASGGCTSISTAYRFAGVPAFVAR